MTNSEVFRNSKGWHETKQFIRSEMMASSIDYAKTNGRIQNCLRCLRCRGFDYDVGKIKQHPKLCLRCAGVMEDSFKGTPAYLRAEEIFSKNEKSIKLRSMETTHKILEFDLVYMAEDVFKDLYKEELLEYVD